MKKIIALLAMVVFAAAGCGDDDRPTGPEQSPLVGSWTWTLEEEEYIFGLEASGLTLTFEDDGTMTWTIGASGLSILQTGTWSVAANRLTFSFRGGVFSYEIRGRELTFSTLEAGTSTLADWDFETDGDPGGALTGVTWVDESDDELVFLSDGTYRWGEGWEEGTWTVEGRTMTVYETSSFLYVVSGNTLTLTDSDVEIVLTKE